MSSAIINTKILFSVVMNKLEHLSFALCGCQQTRATNQLCWLTRLAVLNTCESEAY